MVLAASPESWPPLGSILLQLFVIALFVLLNAFFVAAEFALVKVREGQLDERIAAGSGAALIGKRMLANLNAYLSACQFGITVASLVLGALGEKWIASLLEVALFKSGIELSQAWLHGISWTLAISALTFFHITLGEQVPKTLAIRRSLGTTLFTARPLSWFFTVFGLPVKMLNVASNWMLKLIFRIDPIEGHELSHTSDELALLVEESEKVSEVTETERDILINALALNDLAVRDVMTARGDVVSLDVNDSFEDNVAKALASQHTRFPLVDGHLDQTAGLVHVKDILRLVGEESPNLVDMQREMLEVPEMQAIDELLGKLRTQRSHLALAVDEFGGAVGVVTMEDIIEELVGEIQDEFDDEEQPEFKRIDDDHFVIEGKLPIHELSDHTELEVEDAEVSTMGGYVTHLLGHLPEKGEKVRIDNYEVTVTDTDGRRVLELEFEKRASEDQFPEALRREVADEDGESDGESEG
jgi:CBS domain containing-hemolysin-like protein